jgi:hypothetical protein
LGSSPTRVAATLAETLLVAINLLLRPLVQRISRQPLTSVELPSGYVVNPAALPLHHLATY